ncbi:MAG: transposase, partial [Pseudomonadota bacterium]
QKAPLLAHLEHGEIPIHNNDTERDLRHVVVGKKNWQMFGAKRGGEVAGRLYSLAISCKLNGIDVQSYLEDVLGLISTETDVAALTPWAWEARRRAAAPDPAN